MPVQLTSLQSSRPDPTNLYKQISVGDVGYVREGCFIRMFNVLLEWSDPSNHTLGIPEPYTPLELDPFINIRESSFSGGDYHSRYVTPFHEATNIIPAGLDE